MGAEKSGKDVRFMKWMIASDIHGSAKWCRAMLDAFDRESADRLLLGGIEALSR